MTKRKVSFLPDHSQINNRYFLAEFNKIIKSYKNEKI